MAPGREILNQNIGLGRQSAHDVLSFRCAQVQCDGFFAARLNLPPDRGAVLEQAPFAQRVAGARGLDLDHVGAKVGQRLAGERACDQLTHFQNLQTGQWAGP